MNSTETIAAIATAPGSGGVGIIRISGARALQAGLSIFTFASTFFSPDNSPEPQRLYFGDISFSKEGRCADKGYFVFMKAPNSFTGEDIVELHCHGGQLLLNKILESLLRGRQQGAEPVRLAEPGEFTKRAFLNGKIDLIEAEAVAELIGATNDSALAMASNRLQGRLAKEIAEIKESLVELVSRVEVELDFAEEEIDGLGDKKILEALNSIEARVKVLIQGYCEASAQMQGVKVVITGQPNTGKSSLLNRLLREERAIVTPIAGTTRDVIEERVLIKGLPARLMDTAGLRHGESVLVDEVEAIGIERARAQVKEARVVFFVVDGSEPEHSGDIELLKSLLEDSLDKETSERKFIIVANKSDKEEAAKNKKILDEYGMPVVFISAKNGAGIEDLEETFYKVVTGLDYSSEKASVQGEAFITTVREKDALDKTQEKIRLSKEAVSAGVARECLALELRGALDALGFVVGETTSEDILNRIFSSFCIGK